MEGFLGVTRQLIFSPLKALGKRARGAYEASIYRGSEKCIYVLGFKPLGSGFRI
jgi:hypothetical protein